MNPIFWWFLTVIMDAVCWSFRKKSLDLWKMTSKIFSFFWDLFWFFFIIIALFYFWYDKFIFENPFDIFLLFLISIFETFNWFLTIKIYKKIKLSEILPYENLDSLFIIIIWFFIYYNSDNPTSIITLIISIITIIVIFFFSVNLKKIKFPNFLWWYILSAVINAILVIATWILLFKYSSITYAWFSWFYWFLITFLLIILSKKEKIKIMFSQEKKFYFYRILSSVFWWTSWLIWLYIIKEAWLVVATLLWFLAISFNIVSMKLILKDNPTKKQVILAFLVTILVWIWYYFN